MERKISFEDLRKAVNEAYEEVKDFAKGEIDPRNTEVPDADAFGVAVMLTDGRTVTVGDVDTKTVMGDIAKIPAYTLLLEQYDAKELMNKMGFCGCSVPAKKPEGVKPNPKGVRLFSAVQPAGDPEGKWNLFEGRMIDMMGSAPELEVKDYEAMKAADNVTKFANATAAADWYLFDDAAASADFYIKAVNMKASARQLAEMGATIAADGVNPTNNKVVFDGKISQNVVGAMAAKGPHKMNLPWLMIAGVPAKRSWGGSMVAVYPGVMAIAAYSPKLNASGITARGAAVIKTIMQKLGASVFASARIAIV